MVINKTFAKRIFMLSLVLITCISTALKCQKEDWQMERLPGLEGKKVFADLVPNKTTYKVEDTLTVVINIKPNDLNLENFNKFDFASITGYYLFDNNNLSLDLEAKNSINDTLYFSVDKSILTYKWRCKLIKKGSFILGSSTNYINNSIFDFSVLSGQRIPRSYTGRIPIIFNINNKGYLDIEVE